MSESLSAVAAASEAVDAVANAPETISKLFELARRVIYGTSYSVTYAIVFPTALVLAVVPKRNVLVQGILDASRDAQAKAEEMIG